MSRNRIHIRGDDVLPKIFEKVSACPDTVVTLEADECPTLSNSLSFKILLFRFPDRKFQIVTSDRRLKKVAESLSIRTFSKNDDLEFEAAYAEKNLLKHNFTFFEYLAYEFRKTASYLAFKFKKQKRLQKYKNAAAVKDSGVALLVLGLTVSLSLLAFIFYFAVSRTYVYITPELSVKTTSRNIVFSEKREETILDTQNVVSVRPIEYEASYSQTFNVSTYDTGSVRSARGKIDLFNELPNEQVFRPNTRLVSENGLVFRTSGWVTIPPMKTVSGSVVVGQVETVAYADAYDAKGDIIGVRGNIPEGVVLSIPGLKFNRDKIYARTKEAFRDGQNPTVKILTKSELEQFRSIVAEKLKMKALEGLKSRLRALNAETGSQYDIIPTDDVIRYSEPVTSAGSGMAVGARTSEVTVSGTAKASAHVYDKGAALAYLAGVLRESLLYGTEKLHSVNEDSFRVTNVLVRNQSGTFSMKATCELDAAISYNFEDPSNNLTKKLKNLIVNASEKEATSILLNDSNIASVKFRFSPFWLTRVSSNPDAIEFVIEK